MKNLENQQLEKIYKDNYHKLYSYLIKKLPIHEVEDFINEIFFKFFLKIKLTLINDPASYIFKIARNWVIDYYKTKNKEKLYTKYQKANSSNLQDLKQREIEKEIEFKDYFEKLLKNLSEEEKLILKMKIIEGLSFREISEKLNLNLNTTISKFNRLLKKIKTIKEL
ncbi:MAG: RNA polymerase sigma factor [bacterium]